jgi:uncharacterized membrane protein YgdD (TMEM256/DUF423 family)
VARIMSKILFCFGSLCGACGVLFAALAAHRAGGASLTSAAQFLLFHAPVFLILAVLSGRNFLPRQGLVLGAALLALGVVLFCGDLAWRVFRGSGFFANAAPIGGSSLIAGWIVLALSGLRFNGR